MIELLLYNTRQKSNGWVPKHLLEFHNQNIGIALEDYTAKELNVDEGETKIIEYLKMNQAFFTTTIYH